MDRSIYERIEFLCLSENIDGLKKMILDSVRIRRLTGKSENIDGLEFDNVLWGFWLRNPVMLNTLVSDGEWVAKVTRHAPCYFVSHFDGDGSFLNAAMTYAVTMQILLPKIEPVLVMAGIGIPYFKGVHYQHRSELENLIATSSIVFACKYAIAVLRKQALFVDEAISRAIDNWTKIKNITQVVELLHAYILLDAPECERENYKLWIIKMWRFDPNTACGIALRYVEKHVTSRWEQLENAILRMDKPRLHNVLPVIEAYLRKTGILVLGDFHDDLIKEMGSQNTQKMYIKYELWSDWYSGRELEYRYGIIKKFILTVFKLAAQGKYNDLADELAWCCNHNFGFQRHLGSGVVYDLSTPIIWIMHEEESNSKWHQGMLLELINLDDCHFSSERSVLFEVFISRCCPKELMRIKGDLIARYLSIIGNKRCPLLEHMLIKNGMESLLVEECSDGTSYCSRVGCSIDEVSMGFSCVFAEMAFPMTLVDCLWLHDVSSDNYSVDFYDYQLNKKYYPTVLAALTMIEMGGFDVNRLPLSPFSGLHDAVSSCVNDYPGDKKLISNLKLYSQWDHAKKLTLVDFFEGLEKKYFPQFAANRAESDFLTK